MKKIFSKSYIKVLKTASMDVHIDGFVEPRVLDSVLEICFGLNYVFNRYSFNKEEIEFFRKVRYMEVFAPDGETDPFSRSGIINFYCLGLSKNTINQLCVLIKQYLKENKIRFSSFQYEQIGPRRIQEMKERFVNAKDKVNALSSMNGSEIRVVRIPIVYTSHDRNNLNLPPQINLSNGNANHIFGKVLKYQGEMPEDRDEDANLMGIKLFTGASSFGPIDAQELIKRIDYYLGEKKLEERPKFEANVYYPEEGEEWKGIKNDKGTFINDEDINENTNIGPRFIDFGVDDSYVRERLVQIKQLAQWAITNGYQRIYVA